MRDSKDFVRLKKCGYSLKLTIPKKLLQSLNWREEDEFLAEIREITAKDSFLKDQVESRVLQN